MMQKWFLMILVLVMMGCSSDTKVEKIPKFVKTTAMHTGIHFKNTLTETDSLNYFNFSSIYFGGGVSVGDINNDGLIDVFFTGNQVENRLYLNKGNLQFEMWSASPTQMQNLNLSRLLFQCLNLITFLRMTCGLRAYGYGDLCSAELIILII